MDVNNYPDFDVIVNGHLFNRRHYKYKKFSYLKELFRELEFGELFT